MDIAIFANGSRVYSVDESRVTFDPAKLADLRVVSAALIQFLKGLR